MIRDLQQYRVKRDFKRTSEPNGSPRRVRQLQSKSLFVVQRHAARRLHYDFRLAMDGVLKSWAVPKGIPIQKGERRLAREVEDHPMEYAEFEGTIPAGSYGAGTVQLWDCGRYEVTDGSATASWRKGKISMLLHGRKLKGHWVLVRMHDSGDSGSWLLIKTGESLHRLSVREAHRSAVSGKNEIARSRRTGKVSAGRGAAPDTFKPRIQRSSRG
jgi:bifunctional non-homologous end joining protein LigD